MSTNACDTKFTPHQSLQITMKGIKISAPPELMKIIPITTGKILKILQHQHQSDYTCNFRAVDKYVQNGCVEAYKNMLGFFGIIVVSNSTVSTSTHTYKILPTNK